MTDFRQFEISTDGELTEHFDSRIGVEKKNATPSIEFGREKKPSQLTGKATVYCWRYMSTWTRLQGYHAVSFPHPATRVCVLVYYIITCRVAQPYKCPPQCVVPPPLSPALHPPRQQTRTVTHKRDLCYMYYRVENPPPFGGFLRRSHFFPLPKISDPP